MRSRAIALAAVLMMAPLGAKGADLVVWWEEERYPGENAAVEEIVAAFEIKTGKGVELAFHPQVDLETKMLEAVAAGRPPDFVFGLDIGPFYGQWASEGRLADLSDAIEPFDKSVLPRLAQERHSAQREDRQAGPVRAADGRTSWHVHVWRRLLERAGLTPADIPKQWGAFWSFWCDRAQPALREARGRDDVYGVALQMSVSPDADTHFQQFVVAHGAGLRHPRWSTGDR